MKPVKGFPGYKVDEKGNIYRSGKKLKPQTSVDGYWYVKLSKKGKLTTGYLHKILADAYLPDKPNSNAIANHIDGNKKHNTLDNLEWTGASGNTAHAFEKGLEAPPNGERNGKSKISDEDAKDIRQAVRSGKPKKDIAKSHGISPAMVTRMTTPGTDKSPARRQRDGTKKLHRAEELIKKMDSVLYDD
jgi:hypothetical protein